MHYYRQLVIWFFVLLFLPCIGFAQNIQLSGKEIVRNGDFEGPKYYEGWFCYRFGTWAEPGRDGSTGMALYEKSAEGYAFQMLPVPSVLETVTLQFDFQSTDGISSEYAPAVFRVAIAKAIEFDNNNLGEMPQLEIIDDVVSIELNSKTDWRTIKQDFDQSLISAWPKTPFSRKFSGRSNCDSFNERELLC